jgi:hypothetical protein
MGCQDLQMKDNKKQISFAFVSPVNAQSGAHITVGFETDSPV